MNNKKSGKEGALKGSFFILINKNNILKNNTSIFDETKVENWNKNDTQSETIVLESMNQLISEIKNKTGFKDESINNENKANVDGSNQTSVDDEKQDKTEIPGNRIQKLPFFHINLSKIVSFS